MAESNFKIFKVTDRELISSIKIIVEECNIPEDASLNLRIADKPSSAFSITVGEVDKNDFINKIMNVESSLFVDVRFNIKNIRGCSLIIERGEGSDNVKISFPNDVSIEEVTPLLISSHKHLKTFDRTENIDRFLGKELAEFYRRREQGLVRLENLNQKLIEQNTEYRQRLDEETDEIKKSLETELGSKKESLYETIGEKEKALESYEDQLKKREKDLDDRDNRHARRQIRKDLQVALAARGEEFTLTEKTREKRRPIHALFLSLIAVTAILFAVSVSFFILDPQKATDWYYLLRLTMSVAALAAAIIFYIRWNDQWFRQHADEEFRLKQFELDIDRASWVVEMALEWKDEKGSEIPEELIERLSRNLFIDGKNRESVKHPSEDLASALLGASANLRVPIPGMGDVTLDRRSLKNFKNNAAKAVKDQAD